MKARTKIQASVKWQNGSWSYYTIEKGRNIERFAALLTERNDFVLCALFEYEHKIRLQKVGFISKKRIVYD